MQPRRTIPPGGAIAKRVWGTQVDESESASHGQKSMFPPMFAVLGFRGQSTAVRFASLSGGGRSQLRCLGWYNKVGHPFFSPLYGVFAGVGLGKWQRSSQAYAFQTYASMAGARQVNIQRGRHDPTSSTNDDAKKRKPINRQSKDSEMCEVREETRAARTTRRN